MVTPYDDRTRDKTSQVRDMFDNIAPAYDKLNRAMSFNLDRGWRRKAVDIVKRENPSHIVDIATGTGDFAISLATAIPAADVVGLDLSENMVAVGRKKVASRGLEKRIALTVGDCLASPLAEGMADVVTVAFGVRNFADLSAGYRSMLKMLRPGGMICVLELSTPANPLVRPFYNLYSGHLIPLMGRLMANDVDAYTYLPRSIAAVPQRHEMLRLMEAAGFTEAGFRSLTLGVCIIYTARRPESSTAAGVIEN